MGSVQRFLSSQLYEAGDPFYEELRQELFDEIVQFAKPDKVTVIPVSALLRTSACSLGRRRVYPL